MIFYVFEAFHLMAIPAPDSITVVTSYLLLCAQHHQNNLQISKPLGLSTCFQVNHKAEHFFFFIRFLWCNSFALAAISTSTSYEKRCSDPVNSALCLFAGVLPTALIINPSTIYNMPCFFFTWWCFRPWVLRYLTTFLYDLLSHFPVRRDGGSNLGHHRQI